MNSREYEKRVAIFLRRILKIFFWDFESHVFHQVFDIFPDVAFFAGVTQDVRWVIGAEDFNVTLQVEFSAQLTNGSGDFKE
jgi:hypothetical protein